MKKSPIKWYRLGWNPGTNKGYAEIASANKKTKKLAINSASELSALASVLREAPVFLQEDGLIYSGWEEVDEDV